MTPPVITEAIQTSLSPDERREKLYKAFKNARLVKDEYKNGHRIIGWKFNLVMILAGIAVFFLVIATYAVFIPKILHCSPLIVCENNEIEQVLWSLTLEIILLSLLAWASNWFQALYNGQEFGDDIITKIGSSFNPTSREVEYVMHRMEQNLYSPPSLSSWVISILTYNFLVIVLLGLLGSTTAAKFGVSLGITVEGEVRYNYFIAGATALAFIWIRYLMQHLQQKRIVNTLKYLQNLKDQEEEEERRKVNQEKDTIEKIMQQIKSRELLEEQINLQKSKIEEFERNKLYQLSNKLFRIIYKFMK